MTGRRSRTRSGLWALRDWICCCQIPPPQLRAVSQTREGIELWAENKNRACNKLIKRTGESRDHASAARFGPNSANMIKWKDPPLTLSQQPLVRLSRSVCPRPVSLRKTKQPKIWPTPPLINDSCANHAPVSCKSPPSLPHQLKHLTTFMIKHELQWEATGVRTTSAIRPPPRLHFVLLRGRFFFFFEGPGRLPWHSVWTATICNANSERKEQRETVYEPVGNKEAIKPRGNSIRRILPCLIRLF